MVRELARVLFGPDAMPHVELARWNREDVRGVARDDPILLSQGVRGRTLFEVLQSDDRDTVVKSLDAQSLSQAIVLAMLTMPEDGTSSQPLVGLLALSVIEKSHNLRDGVSPFLPSLQENRTIMCAKNEMTAVGVESSASTTTTPSQLRSPAAPATQCTSM